MTLNKITAANSSHMKNLLLIILFLTFAFSGECQYTFKKQYTDLNGDTIRTYTVFGDSVVGRIKNGYPEGIWSHYFADGSCMKGEYKGFWGQYIGRWDYFDKEKKLTHSKIYYSKKVAFGWKHKEVELDELGNNILLTKHTYKYGGLTDSKRIYKFNQNRKRLFHKDLESIFRVIEKEYYDNGKLKSKSKAIGILNIVIYKEYSENGKLLKKEKDTYMTRTICR